MTEPSLPAVDGAPSWARTVRRLVWTRTSARLGLAWIALVAAAAVFAPWLANSQPLWVVMDGVGQSPALAAMTVADWLWLAGLLWTLALLGVRRGSWSRRLGAWCAAMLVSAALAQALVQPPVLRAQEYWREAERNGAATQLWRAPIPYSPKDYLRDFGDTALRAPLAENRDGRRHWMGTEENGADVASRMIHAARIALGIGFIATGIALAIGVLVGGVMGWFGGRVDMFGMRLVEVFEAIPTLFLLLAFVAFFERSVYMMMVIIGLTSWSGFARYVRAEFFRLRSQPFVQAAQVCALPLSSILFRHMLPNGMAPVLVAASFSVASAILAEATLSFLGLGVLDDPSWGQMLNQAVQASSFNWWMAVFPGGAIFLTVFAYNLVGEALRDALDPARRSAAGEGAA